MAGMGAGHDVKNGLRAGGRVTESSGPVALAASHNAAVAFPKRLARAGSRDNATMMTSHPNVVSRSSTCAAVRRRGAACRKIRYNLAASSSSSAA